MLKKLIRMSLDDLALCCGVVGGVFLLIHIITALTVRFSGEGTSLLLSGVLLPCIAGFMIVICTLSNVMLHTDLAIRYGQTRKRALGLTLGLVSFEALCAMGLAGLLTVLERLFAPGFWMKLAGAQTFAIGRESAVVLPQGIPESQVLQIENFSLAWWWMLAIAAGCLAVGLIAGAVLQRFGGRGGWFLWAIFMVVTLGGQMLPWKTYQITNWLFPLLGVMVLVGLIWSVWSLLHAVVKA